MAESVRIPALYPFLSQVPGLIPVASFLLSSRQKSNRTGVAVRGFAGVDTSP